MTKTIVRAVAAFGALFHLVLGGWAFLAPHSFAGTVATFPPYNRHLTHDIGAFLLGLGAALTVALVWRDGLSVALFGGATAATVHAVGHFFDVDLGGRAADPWLLSGFALLLILALVLRRRAGPSASGS
jgi:hypothetical protein